MSKLGTTEWWQNLADMLNANPEFKKNGKTFTIDILFVVDEDRKNVLKFVEGVCTDVHAAAPGEEDTTEFIISATPEMWKKVQDGSQSARLAVMTEKIVLEKGSMSKLLRYLGAAGLIFDTMKELPTEI